VIAGGKALAMAKTALTLILAKTLGVMTSRTTVSPVSTETPLYLRGKSPMVNGRSESSRRVTPGRANGHR
jgi:hypothetical protein